MANIKLLTVLLALIAPLSVGAQSPYQDSGSLYERDTDASSLTTRELLEELYIRRDLEDDQDDLMAPVWRRSARQTYIDHITRKFHDCQARASQQYGSNNPYLTQAYAACDATFQASMKAAPKS